MKKDILNRVHLHLIKDSDVPYRRNSSPIWNNGRFLNVNGCYGNDVNTLTREF